MFTGIVQTTGRVRSVEPRGGGISLRIDPGGWVHSAHEGDSICVSGCCLTVADQPAAPDGELRFDVVPETLAKTKLGRLGEGAIVNLETSATPQTLLGGHIVQGHVDGVGRVVSVTTNGERRLRVEPPGEVMEFIAPKGSVTLDGVSLTVAALDPGAGWLEVALIPATLEKTTLRGLTPGDSVNVEADAMSKTIVHWLRHYGPGRR